MQNEDGDWHWTGAGIAHLLSTTATAKEASHVMEGYVGYKRNFNPQQLCLESELENKSRKGCLFQVGACSWNKVGKAQSCSFCAVGCP